jgi:hypothetical protein
MLVEDSAAKQLDATESEPVLLVGLAKCRVAAVAHRYRDKLAASHPRNLSQDARSDGLGERLMAAAVLVALGLDKVHRALDRHQRQRRCRSLRQ